MGRIHRYRTAISRHHRSGGFGIHSPFAFDFVKNVLGQRLPYYAYEYIDEIRAAVKATRHRRIRDPRMISAKNAKLLFRIANHFNPKHILQIGTKYGISAASMMAVSSKSDMHLYEPGISTYPVVGNVLEPFLDAIECYDNLDLCIKEYQATLQEEDIPFMLVNDIPHDEDYDAIQSAVFSTLEDTGVVVMRNLSKKSSMKRLWLAAKGHMVKGQTFTNEKIAILYATPKLNLEHFLLWF